MRYRARPVGFALASVWRDRARKALADDAEQLQMEINESIGNAIVTGVDLPGALYDADAELLLLPDRLRQPATSSRLDAPNRGSGRTRRRLRLLGR
jgi:hypothetical protein